MRFLFVYQDDLRSARRLIGRLGLEEVVEVVSVAHGQIAPDGELEVRLRAQGDAVGAACGVNRKYKKAVAALCKLEIEPKTFREDDKVLYAWLVPPTSEAASALLPRAAFAAALAAGAKFIVADGALDSADKLSVHRHRFVERSVTALDECARDPAAAGIPREWESTRGLAFAPNGKVVFKYRLMRGGVCVKTARTQWHLKSGDATSRESAARIYFTIEIVGEDRYVVVLYCGPHPDPGEYTVIANL